MIQLGLIAAIIICAMNGLPNFAIFFAVVLVLTGL